MTKFLAELHRPFKCGLIGFAQETSGGQTKGREEEKLQMLSVLISDFIAKCLVF